MSTEMVLLEARMALAQVRDDGPMIFIGLALAIVGIALWLEYVIRRWSWIPRKRHDRVFIERF